MTRTAADMFNALDDEAREDLQRRANVMNGSEEEAVELTEGEEKKRLVCLEETLDRTIKDLVAAGYSLSGILFCPARGEVKPMRAGPFGNLFENFPTLPGEPTPYESAMALSLSQGSRMIQGEAC